MSHCRTQQMALRASEIDALQRAVGSFKGVRMVEAADFRWWSGKKACNWRIEREGATATEQDFHVGIRRTGADDLEMEYDDYGSQGGWITKTFGSGLGRLHEQYQAVIAEDELTSQGFNVHTWRDESTGDLVVEADR